MPTKLTEILVCPVCKGPLLKGVAERSELICPRCRRSCEVRDDIPVMRRSDARELNEAEAEHYREAADRVSPARR